MSTREMSGRKAIQVVINNLDFDVALYPMNWSGENRTGRNWMQHRLIKKYLSNAEETDVVLVSSGIP